MCFLFRVLLLPPCQLEVLTSSTSSPTPSLSAPLWEHTKFNDNVRHLKVQSCMCLHKFEYLETYSLTYWIWGHDSIDVVWFRLGCSLIYKYCQICCCRIDISQRAVAIVANRSTNAADVWTLCCVILGNYFGTSQLVTVCLGRWRRGISYCCVVYSFECRVMARKSSGLVG